MKSLHLMTKAEIIEESQKKGTAICRKNGKKLSLNNEADLAKIRVIHKRAMRKAIKDGLTVPNAITEYAELSTCFIEEYINRTV